MQVNDQVLVEAALSMGATRAAVIDPADIDINEEIRAICSSNGCGQYGTNWGCPPGVGELDALRTRVRSYRKGLLFQCVSQLEDSFDFEGMAEAGARHARTVADLAARCRGEFGMSPVLPLGAGGCTLCKRCAYLDGKPCIRPDEATSSVEAYGMHVPNLLALADMTYNNGVHTVSYVGLILYDRMPEA